MNRDEILQEMGLAPLWRLRRPLPGAAPVDAAPAGAAVAAEPMPVAAPELPVPDAAVTPPVALPASLPESSATPELAFDSEVVVGRQTPAARPLPAPIAAPEGRPAIGIGPERQGQIAALDWDSLQAATAECRACGLCRQRRQAVFGVGDPRPDWVFVGEGPGEQEDQRGEPFVGPAGQLLDAMLAAISLQRGDKVYIANAVKCRPPGNRTPSQEEIAACRPFLMRQIALMRPKLIVLLGKAAVSSVLDLDTSLGGLRGRVHKLGSTPVVVTYHPAYLLRTLPEKAKAWEDLCLARRLMRAPEQGA